MAHEQKMARLAVEEAAAARVAQLELLRLQIQLETVKAHALGISSGWYAPALTTNQRTSLIMDACLFNGADDSLKYQEGMHATLFTRDQGFIYGKIPKAHLTNHSI